MYSLLAPSMVREVVCMQIVDLSWMLLYIFSIILDFVIETTKNCQIISIDLYLPKGIQDRNAQILKLLVQNRAASNGGMHLQRRYIQCFPDLGVESLNSKLRT